MTAKPPISVIIPTFRELDCLKLALSVFLKEPRCEVVVGLDGDNPMFHHALAGLPITLSWTARRQGACTATNLAASQAKGEYLLLCNDDMVPAKGWCDAMLGLAGPNTIVSGTCWEPGLVPAPPPHRVCNLGHDPGSFRIDEFYEKASREEPGSVPGINYPFLIPKQLWDRVGGLDPRFEPGSASDPDLFIRLALLDPKPVMVRAQQAVFYHFASRSSIFAGGRLSLVWKLHRRHGRAMFRHKWGRMWQHRFGEVPKIETWCDIVPRPEPSFRGKLWRRVFFATPGGHRIKRPIENSVRIQAGDKAAIFIWGGLGNAVMALPLVNAASEALGDEKVTVFLPKQGWGCLFRDSLKMERVYPHRALISNKIRAEISLSSLPYPKWRYGLASLMVGAKTRVGGSDLANPLLNRTVDTKRSGQHWVERNLALLQVLGIVNKNPKFGIPIDLKSLAAARMFLKNSVLGRDDSLIGLHPGSGNPMRRWPEANFIGLGKALVSKGKKIVVFGGPGEEALAARVAGGIGMGASVFCRDLPEALALISLCRAFVAADSGLAHCAAALGVSTLALMGPSDESLYRPYGPKVKVVSGRADCRPCYRPGGAIRCKHQRRICLDIGVEEALQGLKELV